MQQVEVSTRAAGSNTRRHVVTAVARDAHTWFAVSQWLSVAVLVGFVLSGASVSVAVVVLFAAATLATAIEFALDPKGWRRRGALRG